MNERNKKLFGVLAALSLIVAGGGAAYAAPGSIHSGATDTADVTYMDADKTVDTQFNASGTELYGLPILNSTTSNLAMNVSHGGEEYYSFNGTWDDYADDPTSGDDYVHNVSDSDLSDVPVTPGENVTLNVTYWNASASSPTPTTIQVYVEATDERTVVAAEEGSPFVENKTEEQPIYRGSDEYKAVSVDDNATINGTNTTVIYTLDSNTSGPFANTTEGLSDTGTLTFVKADIANSSDGYDTVAVFYKGTPDWHDPAEHGSYGVYDPNANTVSFTLTDDKFGNASYAQADFTSDPYRAGDVGTVFELAGGWDGNGVQAVGNMVM